MATPYHSLRKLAKRIRRFFVHRWHYLLYRKQRRQTHDGLIYAVAIMKDEEYFLEEWIAYHRLIGVDHFIIYDNDPALPLKTFLAAHSEYLTVIDWAGEHPDAPGATEQLKAYLHSLTLLPANCRWVTFIDGDEFIALKKDKDLRQFLLRFGDAGSVRLNWHIFGHNGFYHDPPGLVTASLTRRMVKPGNFTKAITRPEAIADITRAHACALKPGWSTVDANNKPFSKELYPGKTDVAHVNHYMCRSFTRWMARLERGDVSFDSGNAPEEHRWRVEPDLLLKQFVTTVARDKNEYVDLFMQRYQDRIRMYMAKVVPAQDRAASQSAPMRAGANSSRT